MKRQNDLLNSDYFITLRLTNRIEELERRTEELYRLIDLQTSILELQATKLKCGLELTSKEIQSLERLFKSN